MPTGERRRGRRWFLRIGAVALAGGLAGCTDDDDGDPTTTTTGTATETRTTTTTGTATETRTTTPPGSLERTTRFLPDDGDEGDRFGLAVALAGDTALVGAPLDEDPGGSDAGSAYVFERSGDGWAQRTKLVDDDGDEDDEFGRAVALAGDTALVGAPREEDPNGMDAGAVYVFERGDGEWGQAGKLVADDGDEQELFGQAITIDGDTALVGVPRDEAVDDPEAFVGSVHVFERAGGGWERTDTLFAKDGDAADQFGSALGLDGDTAVVGAPTDDDPNGSDAGSAYVFERSADGWTQRAKLVADEGATGDRFGTAVSVAGDVVAVGFPRHEPDGLRWGGAAAVFERSGGEWSQTTTLTADDAEDGDRFGGAVAVGGGRIHVASPTDDNDRGPGAGAVYVFERADGEWGQARTIVPDDVAANDGFGGSIALSPSGAGALVGADGAADPNGRQAGAAYAFER